MRFIITGRNIDVTEGLRSAVEEKLGKLDRSSRNIKCREGKTEDRSYNPSQG